MATVLITMAEGGRCGPSRFDHLVHIDSGDSILWTRELQHRGHRVLWANWRDFDASVHDGAGTFTRLYDPGTGTFTEALPLHALDLVWIYKMEGFLEDQERFLGMVTALEKATPEIMNLPPLIRHNIDKHYLFDLARAGVRTVPSSDDPDQAKAWLTAGHEVIAKPWRSERSVGLHRLNSMSALQALEPRNDGWLFQRFVPEIRHGECSLMFLGAAFQFAAIKIPRIGEIRTNQRFRSERRPHDPSHAERELAESALAAYAGLGYEPRFSRIDLLRDAQGPMVIEAELLNPSTGRECLPDDRFDHAIVTYLESLI